MPKRLPPVTDAELSVMQCLWDAARGPWSTKREIMDQLYPRGAESDLATVQKLLERLETKGLVQRDRSETTHRFAAECSKDQFASFQMRALADQVSGGSLVSLMMQLVDAKNLSKQERKQIRDVLDESGNSTGASS